MKKIVVLIIFCIIYNMNAGNNRLNIKIDSLVVGQTFAMKKFKNKVFVAGVESGLNAKKIKYGTNSFLYTKISLFDGNIWKILPNSVNKNGINIPIATSTQSRGAFDSLGNIYICGAEIYKYDGTNWSIISNNDKFSSYRMYQDICIDKYNNIWFTDKLDVRDTNNKDNMTNFIEGHSELYKYDGKKFELKLKTDDEFSFYKGNNGTQPSCFSALANGDLIINRMYDDSLIIKKNHYSTAYLFRTNGIIDTIQIPLADQKDSTDIANRRRNVSQFNQIGDDLYVNLNDVMKTDKDGLTSFCCAGLSVLRGNTWKTFDESNNLKKGLSYSPVHRVNKIKDKLYAIVENKFATLENNFFKYLEWEILLNSSKLIPYNASLISDISNLDNLIESTQGLKPLFSTQLSDFFEYNNSIWIQHFGGIFIIDNSLLSVDEKSDNEDIIIAPNITNESINIINQGNATYYEIYNIIGELLIKENITSNKIDVTKFSSGTYIIKFSNGISTNVQKFIKY